MINKPFGVGMSGYSYDFYHKNRLPLNEEATLQCAETDYSIYILVRFIILFYCLNLKIPSDGL